MQDKFAHAQDVSNYLTYRHRRNSILGGGIDPDDDDEEMQKGWMSVDRINQDHRIPTPADTCGAATSRFKHRLVANIARVTSLYGKELRSLFGVDVEGGYYQLGYDFSSLEAMIEASYCWRYDVDEKTYCKSLTLEKPNDVHTKTAEKISQVLGKPFARAPAKSVKYCCAYGGQPPRVAKTVGCDLEDGKKIYTAYWEAAAPLGALGDKLKSYWETVGGKKFVLGLDGRKVPTRSASALINSLFQSAGVICAKRAMVIHDRLMREAGLRVNFWKEDWKNRKFVQQLIAYHKCIVAL
jgi:DNA polymerase I-like protein with 3'-5' exonuclease and polymerase domains